jgi:hypothetical protein
MSISFDGNSLVFDGTVTITNFTDTTTGVATLMLTPNGGLGSFPTLAAGESGLPPVFDSVVMNEVNPGDTLPASTFTLVSPGGPGVASHYVANLYVHKGATGSTGPSTNISAAPDVEGTLTDSYILVYNTADTKWKISAQKVGDIYVPSTISSTSGNASTRTLCSFTVPALPYDWRPLAWGQCIVSGTINTRVDLVARVNNATTGDVFAKGFGLAGVTDRPYIIPAIPPGSASSYAKVSAGSSATIYLQAIQQNGGTTDSWTTDTATTTFELKVNPVQ